MSAEREKPDYNMTTALLQRVFSGEKVREHSGEWEIYSMHPLPAVTLDYVPLGDKLAHYAFDIIDDRNLIILNNIHKRAQPGHGTPSVQAFEQVLEKVAREMDRDILVVFSVLGNPDTMRWLEKNLYMTENPEASIFQKRYKKLITRK